MAEAQLFCRIAAVAELHSYSLAGMKIPANPVFLSEYGGVTMIAGSPGQIMTETARDHESHSHSRIFMVMHCRSWRDTLIRRVPSVLPIRVQPSE
jgi:hypothetical protein